MFLVLDRDSLKNQMNILLKIRLPIETWNSFLDLVESPNPGVPSDARIILCKLIDENAFAISATRHEVVSFIDIVILD